MGVSCQAQVEMGGMGAEEEHENRAQWKREDVDQQEHVRGVGLQQEKRVASQVEVKEVVVEVVEDPVPQFGEVGELAQFHKLEKNGILVERAVQEVEL